MTQLIVIAVLFAVAAAFFEPLKRNKKPRARTRRAKPQTAQLFDFAEPTARDIESPRDAVAQAFIDAMNGETPPKPAVAYRDKFRLLNGTEIALYQRLLRAVPAMIVFSQVSMSQLFHIRGKNSHMQINEIGKKSLDFVICRQDTSIVAVLEFNGPTHLTPERMRSDEKKKSALEQAGIPLLVICETPLPTAEELRKLLAPLVVERKQREYERDIKLHRKSFP